MLKSLLFQFITFQSIRNMQHVFDRDAVKQSLKIKQSRQLFSVPLLKSKT
jgi:hypothetical protein